MNEVNPYAAPSDLKEAPEGADQLPWRVVGSVLLFRDDTHLPGVDLFSGRQDIEMTTAASSFSAARSQLSAWIVGLVCATLVVLLFRSESWQMVWSGMEWLKYPVMIVVGILIAVIGSRSFSLAQLTYYVASKHAKRKKVLYALMLVGGLLGGGLMVVVNVTGIGSLRICIGIVLGVILLLVVLFAVAYVTGLRLRCSASRDGWFELRGIPDPALAALMSIQMDSAHGEPDQQIAPSRSVPHE